MLAACVAMSLGYLKRMVRYERLVNLLAIELGIGAPFSNIRKLEQQNFRVHSSLSE